MKKRNVVKLVRQKKKFDIWIAILALCLSLFGIIMIYESSNVMAFQTFRDKYHFVKDQSLWLIIGVALLVITSFIHYKKYYTLSLFVLILSLLLLIAVFIPGIGVKTLGAHRWINLKSFSFQPAEFAKLALILYLSSWFTSFEKKRLVPFLLLLILVVGLVMLQPDLGTATILTSIFIVMYFLSGASIWNFLILVPFVAAATVGLVIISPYRFQRLMTFLNPSGDPLGSSYHIRQILISLGSGGFWGLGLGASRQKYQFLPEATTDSIFAIIGEEFGFIGASLLIIIFIIFLYRIFRVVRKTSDRESYLLSGGILTLIAVQTIINLGSMVTLFPLTGVPLPFISYGGSNLLISLVAVGIVLNISKHVSS